MGVTKHDDMLYLERGYAELQRRGNAVRMPVGRVRRHDIRHVAHHENLARARVEDGLRRDARVAAADDHDFRRLADFRELAIAVLLAAQAAVEKGVITFDQAFGNGMRMLLVGTCYTSRRPLGDGFVP